MEPNTIIEALKAAHERIEAIKAEAIRQAKTGDKFIIMNPDRFERERLYGALRQIDCTCPECGAVYIPYPESTADVIITPDSWVMIAVHKRWDGTINLYFNGTRLVPNDSE
jgi:hypothetical protein